MDKTLIPEDASLPSKVNSKKKRHPTCGCLIFLPLMRGGGLRLHVMLCWRGLRTTHIHRPLTTYFLGAKIDVFFVTSKLFRPFLTSES